MSHQAHGPHALVYRRMTYAQRLLAYSKTDDRTGCMEWQRCLHRDGYGKVCYQGKAQWAHRVAWQVWRGEIPNGMHVLHRCDNRKCINPDHLFIGTNEDNISDCAAKGRGAICIPKIPASAAREICDRRFTGVALARKYGVSTAAISLYRKRMAAGVTY